MEHVSAVTLHYIIKVLETNYKIDTKELLKQVGINPNIFKEENSYIESDKIKLLFRQAAMQCKDPCLALKLGANSSPESIGLLGYMLANTATLEEMLNKMCHYSVVIGKSLNFELIKLNNEYKLVFSMYNNATIPLERYQTEIHLSAIISLIRQLCGINILPSKAYFQHKSVEIREEYEKLFGKNLYFDAFENALVFSEEQLGTPLKSPYPGLLKYFESEAEKIIEVLYYDTWHSKVKKCILLRLGNNDVDVEAIAKHYDISGRTLQKYLQKEGYNYTQLLEDIRKNLSKYYLQNFSIDIGTIALYVGYNDISSFTRSFKKWFGVSPQNYRKDLPYNSGHSAISS